MDALKLIAQDHKELRARFVRLEQLIRLSSRPDTEWTDKLILELALHAEREEPLLRSALEASIDGELPEGVALADALVAMREDRKRLHGLFSEFSELKRELLEAKRRATMQLAIALEVHAEQEEHWFYPELAALMPTALPVQVAGEEHSLMRLLTQEVLAADMRDPGLDAKLRVLMKLTAAHMREEERGLLAEARRILTVEDRQALGEAMRQSRDAESDFRITFGPILGAGVERAGR